MLFVSRHTHIQTHPGLPSLLLFAILFREEGTKTRDPYWTPPPHQVPVYWIRVKLIPVAFTMLFSICLSHVAAPVLYFRHLRAQDSLCSGGLSFPSLAPCSIHSFVTDSLQNFLWWLRNLPSSHGRSLGFFTASRSWLQVGVPLFFLIFSNRLLLTFVPQHNKPTALTLSQPLLTHASPLVVMVLVTITFEPSRSLSRHLPSAAVSAGICSASVVCASTSPWLQYQSKLYNNFQFQPELSCFLLHQL